MLELRPHQVQALADLTRAFAVHDRALVVLPCGAGKTLIAAAHAAASEAATTLVLVPSLALLAQTLREWRRLPGWSFDALLVCSDPTTSAGAAELAEDGEEGVAPGAVDLSCERAQVTTNPGEVDRFLRRARPGRAQVVFATYHSAPVVAAGQARAEVGFDLAVCDEAHRLAGNPRQEFLAALDPRQIVARRRLFMTATPRLCGPEGLSMSDAQTFGPLAHEVTFGDAIRAGLLCDYRVLVVSVSGEAPTGLASIGADAAGRSADPLALTPAALVEAVDGHGVSRVLSFHGRVAKAEAFAQTVDAVRTPGGRRVAARHVSGAMPTERRSAALAWLAGPVAEGEVRVLSNARVLSEGVDVPSVDAVLFADARSSPVSLLLIRSTWLAKIRQLYRMSRASVCPKSLVASGLQQVVLESRLIDADRPHEVRSCNHLEQIGGWPEQGGRPTAASVRQAVTNEPQRRGPVLRVVISRNHRGNEVETAELVAQVDWEVANDCLEAVLKVSRRSIGKLLSDELADVGLKPFTVCDGFSSFCPPRLVLCQRLVVARILMPAQALKGLNQQQEGSSGVLRRK